MRQSLSQLPCIFLLFILFSCSPDSLEKEQEPELKVQDTYGYIVFRSDGQLFEIGNKTGNITEIAQIQAFDFSVVLNAVTSSASKIYIYEHRFDPFRGIINVYDMSTKKTSAHVIDFPVNTFGEYPGIVSLEWDETNQNLIALVQENFEDSGAHVSRVARIDPATFEVEPMGIEVNKAHIVSTVLKGNRIFTSSYRTSIGSGMHDFFEINLSTGAVTSIPLAGFDYAPIHLSKDESSNKVFGFLPVANTGVAGAAEPALIDVSTGAVTLLMPDEVTAKLHGFGRSFYNKQTKEHVDLIGTAKYIALFQYNGNTGKITTTKISVPNDIGTSVIIIGAVPKS